MSSSTGFSGGGFSAAAASGWNGPLVNPGASDTVTVTHGLGTEDVAVFLRRISDGKNMLVDWRVTGPNQVAFHFAIPPPDDTYRVVVVPT